MARLEEQIRQIKLTVSDPDLQRAAISELHRRDALKAVKGTVVSTVKPGKDWHDALLETSTGRQVIQAKLDAELKLQAICKANLEAGDRIRQLKELVHDVFVVRPRIAEPIDGWKPRIRFDIYQASKETCRRVGQAGGAEYERVVTAMKYAMTGSKAYREAVEVLGL